MRRKNRTFLFPRKNFFFCSSCVIVKQIYSFFLFSKLCFYLFAEQDVYDNVDCIVIHRSYSKKGIFLFSFGSHCSDYLLMKNCGHIRWAKHKECSMIGSICDGCDVMCFCDVCDRYGDSRSQCNWRHYLFILCFYVKSVSKTINM